MRIERLSQIAIALLVFVIGASVLSGSAASTTVPKSSTSEQSKAQGANDFKPAVCAAFVLTALVTGTGAINGTGAAELILGSNVADVITGNGGNDCILSGGGADRVHAGTGAGAGGGAGAIDGGPGAIDICLPEGGTSTTTNCEQTVLIALLGAWSTGLVKAAVAGNSRLLIFVAGSEDGAARNINTLTYGGQAMTQAAAITSGGVTRTRTEVWYLREAGIAAAASANFVPTWNAAPGAPHYSAAFFSGVHQGTPVGATATNIGDETVNPITISTAALGVAYGDMVVYGAQAGRNITFTAQNAFTEGTDFNAGGTTRQTAGHKVGRTAATETPATLTSSFPNRWSMAGVVLKALSTP